MSDDEYHYPYIEVGSNVLFSKLHSGIFDLFCCRTAMTISDKFPAFHAELHEIYVEWGLKLEKKYIESVKDLQPPWDAPESLTQTFNDYVHEVLLDICMEKDRIEGQKALRTFVQDLRKFSPKSAQESRECLHFLETIEADFMRKMDDLVNDVKRQVLAACEGAHEGQVDDKKSEGDEHTDGSFEMNDPVLDAHDWECQILATEDEWFKCEDPDQKHILVKELEQLEIEYAVTYRCYEDASRNFVRHEIRKRTHQRVSKEVKQWHLPGKSINKRTWKPKRPSEKVRPKRYDVATDRLLYFHEFHKENGDLCRRDLFKKWNSMLRLKPAPYARWWGNRKVTLDWCLERFAATYSREDIESWFGQLERVE